MRILGGQDIPIHPVTMRFDGNIEDAFVEDYFDKTLVPIRRSLVLGIFLYAVFGILDYLLIPAVRMQIWVIRYLVVCPIMILFLAFTWTRLFKKVMMPALVVISLVIGFGIIAMTIIAYPPGSYYYYAGLILVLMWVYTVIGAQFIYATFAGWTIFAAYEIVTILLGNTPVPVMISNTFFFFSANVIGMMACYLIELSRRRDFWQRYLLEKERAKSELLLEELHSELQLASDIQKSLLPPSFYEWQGGEIICFSKPTLEIGGDFYSYHFYEHGRLALAMGDVSGHGIPAALLTAATLSLYDTTFAHRLQPWERLAQLDLELVPYTEPRHQNCAFCYVELDQCVLTTANAGGIPPYIRKRDGEVQRLEVKGLPLGHGLGASIGYSGVQVTLTDGDMVILTTDGAVEAMDSQQNMFGFERLKQAIAAGPNGTAQAMLDHLVREVSGFMDGNPLQDDFSLAIVRIKS